MRDDTTPSRRLRDEIASTGSALSEHERKALVACEAIIAESLGAWVNVSNALAEIAAARLYRDEHATFADYCRERWGVSRSQGHRLVLSARVAMSPVGDRITNERQAREVAGLLDDPALLCAVVERAEEIQGTRPMTARALRQARAELALAPEEVAPTRALYEAAEWTRESLARWQEDACEIAARYVADLPPASWAWGNAEMQTDDRDETEALRLLVRRLAFDAPLTEEVCLFLRDAPALAGMTLPEVFTGHIGGLSQLGAAFGKMEQGLRDSASLTTSSDASALVSLADVVAPVPQAFGAAVRLMAERMAEVLGAVAEARDVPPRAWTPGEVERAREAWAARVTEAREQGRIGTFPPGPLLDGVRDGYEAVRVMSGELGEITRMEGGR